MKTDHLCNIVLLGGPGSGKGTQAGLIQEKYGLTHLSTGQLFRNEIASGSEIGRKAKEAIDRGDFCSDEVTLDMVNKFMGSFHNPKGFIFDGVPRTLEQAKRMDGIQYSPAIPVDLVLNLLVEEDEIIKRILKRAELEGRSDDTPEVVVKRIENYHVLTEPLIQYYKDQGKLFPVNGMQSIEHVFADIMPLIDTQLKMTEKV